MSDMNLEQRIEALEGRVVAVEAKVDAVAASVGEGSLEPGYGYGGTRPPSPSPTPGNLPDPEAPAPEAPAEEAPAAPTEPDISAEEAAWVSAVAKIQADYGMSESEANAALVGVLVDHDTRGVLWTTAIREIMQRDGVDEATANHNLQNLLATKS